MNAATRRHMDKVVSLGCILCRKFGEAGTPAELHHIRESEGMSMRAQNTLVIPLCPEHHRGATGLHGLGTRMFYTRYRLDELDLLAETIEAIS